MIEIELCIDFTQARKMVKRLSNMACWLIFVATFLFGGCKQQYREDILAPDPNLETLATRPVPDYAYRAIEATGGMQSWVDTERFQLDCVLSFYQPDDSCYLTEQRYEIYPWLNAIGLSAREPQGRFVCQLSRGRFRIIEGAGRISTLSIPLCERYLAEAVLNLTTASVRLLDKSVEFTRSSRAVKIEGLWYYPIERTSSTGTKQGSIKPYWSKVVFYQNRGTSLVDVLFFADVKEENFFIVHGYDYYKVGDSGIWIPGRIEIFRTDATGTSCKLMVRIESFPEARRD